MNQLALDLQPTRIEYRIHLHANLYAVVDADDYRWLSQFKWSALIDRDTGTYRATRQVVDGSGRPKTVIMAREIMGNPKGRNVDHRNHDTLDNRRRNLRVCDHAQNAQNRRRFKNNRSGHKGVCWRPECKKWRAYINVDNKRINLGNFDSKEAASAAYESAAAILHGEFRCAE
jgi:hypothetical protein